MTQTEISEYNRRCAEFLGYEISENKECFKLPNKNGWINLDIFYSDWNWVMNVVEAIEDIIFDEDNSFNVTIGSTNYCVIQDSNGEVYETIQDYGNSKLETVIKAINQFLIWYNEQVNETDNVNKKM